MPVKLDGRSLKVQTNKLTYTEYQTVLRRRIEGLEDSRPCPLSRRLSPVGYTLKRDDVRFFVPETQDCPDHLFLNVEPIIWPYERIAEVMVAKFRNTSWQKFDSLLAQQPHPLVRELLRSAWETEIGPEETWEIIETMPDGYTSPLRQEEELPPLFGVLGIVPVYKYQGLTWAGSSPWYVDRATGNSVACPEAMPHNHPVPPFIQTHASHLYDEWLEKWQAKDKKPKRLLLMRHEAGGICIMTQKLFCEVFESIATHVNTAFVLGTYNYLPEMSTSVCPVCKFPGKPKIDYCKNCAIEKRHRKKELPS